MKTRRLASTYEDSQILIQAGLYVSGTDPVLDEAISYHSKIEEFLSQVDVTAESHWFDRDETCNAYLYISKGPRQVTCSPHSCHNPKNHK